MNSLFSFRRFGHVVRWTLAHQMRQLLTLFYTAVIMFAAFEMPEFVQANHDYAYRVSFSHESQETIINHALRDAALISLLLGLVMLCVGAAFAFYHLHHKNEGRQLLMLPATHLEKFLARWVVYVPVLFALFVVAFMLGDLLRMAVWPVFGGGISFPSAIPEFFRNLKDFFWPMSAYHAGKIFLLWALVLFFHALSLFSSVWIGRWGWLLVTIVFFAVAADILGSHYHGRLYLLAILLYALTVLLTLFAYRLFCRFPKYKLFHFKD